MTNFWIIPSLKPTHGLQEMHMDKSFKHNSMQPLVHTECHQLPKPHMGAPHVVSRATLKSGGGAV